MLELSIVRREEWLAQTFRKDLSERNLEKTMKIMLSSSPSLVFHKKAHNIRFENQIHILS